MKSFSNLKVLLGSQSITQFYQNVNIHFLLNTLEIDHNNVLTGCNR